jgi:formate-dependent nitrite reductase cytochrome c552 subunit
MNYDSEFLKMMDETIKRHMNGAKSEGYKECQKYSDDKLNKVILNIATEILDIRDKETDLIKVQERLDNVINFINKYRIREELYQR